MIDLPMAVSPQNERMGEDERQIAVGFGFCHNQINTLARRMVEASTQAGALASLLAERGLITQDELDTHRAAERQRLMQVLAEEDFGIAISEEFPDKYAMPAEKLPDIDCEARYHLCRAACCAMHFPLTAQDLEEGLVRWELGKPYLIRQDTHCGRCVHQDPESYRCGVYEQRPGICRAYDCRKDSRIWLDFENRVINPDLFVTMPDGTVRPTFPKPNQNGKTHAVSGDEGQMHS